MTDIFQFQSLYNTLGLWILTLTLAIVYQSEVGESKHMNLDSVCWVLAFNVVLMLLLSAQVSCISSLPI